MQYLDRLHCYLLYIKPTHRTIEIRIPLSRRRPAQIRSIKRADTEFNLPVFAITQMHIAP